MPFHHKKPFDPSGDVYANSVTRTMKSQALDTWDMFTRETLQNSWDARDTTSTDDGVTFALDFRELTQLQLDELRNSVFGNDFVGIDELKIALEGNSLDALCISDSGTHGLRGPSKANAATGGPTDFSSFIRNIGRSDSKILAGGTYGFGKGVFFIASKVHTVVVYTRTTDENDQRVNRLIAMANANDFTDNGIAYTGRHWWGERAVENTGKERTEYAEPIIGSKADAIAAVLGLDTYFDEKRPTGTSIMVLAPDVSSKGEDSGSDNDGEASRRVMRQIADSLTRWAWPHMLEIDTGMDPIDFIVSHKNERLKITDPDRDPALRRFIDAYMATLNYNSPEHNTWKQDFRGRIATVAAARPKKVLGVVSLIDLDDGKAISADDTVIGRDISSHIATIRNPRMIVEYYNAQESGTGKPYCGVFIADPEADKIFARSEPAAHHQWNHETIAHDHRLLKEFWGSTHNPVKIFQTRLKSLVKSTETIGPSRAQSKHFKAATELSNSFGSLIANASGQGNAISIASNAKVSKSKKTSSKNATYDTAITGIKNAENGTVVTFSVTVQIPTNKLPARIRLEPAVFSDQGNIYKTLESVGGPIPEILNVTQDSPSTLDMVEPLTDPEIIATTEKSVFRVDVYQPADTAIALQLSFTYNVGEPANNE